MHEQIKSSGVHEKESIGLPAESRKSLEHTKSNKAKYNREISFDGSSGSSPSSLGVQREIKNISYKQTLQRVQDQLPIIDRLFSRVIHKPVIYKVSDIAGNTIGRPSGMLGGSLFTLVGSVLLLYASRHYGFRYNYLVFSLLFIAGFAAGLLIELFGKIAAKKRGT